MNHLSYTLRLGRLGGAGGRPTSGVAAEWHRRAAHRQWALLRHGRAHPECAAGSQPDTGGPALTEGVT